MRKHRGLLGIIVAIALCVTMLFGGGLLNAFAAPNIGAPDVISSFSIPSTVRYNGERTFAQSAGVTLEITPPDKIKGAGEVLDLDAGEKTYKFKQVGIYDLVFKKGGNVVYSKTVYCELEGEYELRVEYDGADIPTVTAAEKSFNVPKAALYIKTDDMDEFELAEDHGIVSEPVITVYDWDGDVMAKKEIDTDTYAFEKPGAYTITYSAQVDGSVKYFTKNYNVNVNGKDFKDNKAPSITLPNIQQNASVNTKYTISKASIVQEGEIDKNVKVTVTVTHNGEPVKVANVNKKTGFATGIAPDAEAIVFDNIYTDYFYPTETGEYLLKYEAKDDFGNPAMAKSFPITVTDRSAPTLSEIDDFQIPLRWGKTVKKYVDDAGKDYQEELDDLTITFPYPTYIDNTATWTEKDEAPFFNDGVKRVGFEIKYNSKTVIRFYDIYNKSGKGEGGNTEQADNVYKYDASKTSFGFYQEDTTLYPNGLKFDESGLKFDFANFIKNLDGKGNVGNESGTGVYTAQYQARDEEGLITTKTYTINLDEEFIDDIKPNIGVTFDKYLYINESVKSYTVPSADITDAGTDKTKTVYTVKNESGDPTDFLTVKSGEKLDIEYVDASTILLKNADYKYIDDLDPSADTQRDEMSMNIYGASELTLNILVEDSVGNQTVAGDQLENKLKIITDGTLSAQSLALNTGAVTYDGAPVTFGGIKQGAITRVTDSDSPNFDKFELGSFAITGIEHDLRNFTGFEMKLTELRDGKEIIMNNMSFETFYVSTDVYTGITGGKGMRVVDKIVLALSDGDFRLSIRAFDISGNSSVATFALTIDDGVGDVDPGGDNLPASAPIPPQGKVNETFTLRNSSSFRPPLGGDADRAYMVRRVSGAGNFSLMGHEFTSFAQGVYTFNEGSYLTNGDYKKHQTDYTFDSVDDTDPVFEIQGVMPTYATKGETVQLPSVIAHNTYANADIKVTVKSANTVLQTSQVPFDAATNTYSFKTTEDTTYTVTYTASINNSSASMSVDIKSGDSVAPVISANSFGDRTVGNTYFKFSEIFVDRVASAADLSDLTDDLSDIKFTKVLVLPNQTRLTLDAGFGKDAAEETVMTGSGWTEDGYKLDTPGDYSVEYYAEDKHGNRTEGVIYSFQVFADSKPGDLGKIIAVVVIICVIILIVGLILYFTRFQKKKIKKA